MYVRLTPIAIAMASVMVGADLARDAGRTVTFNVFGYRTVRIHAPRPLAARIAPPSNSAFNRWFCTVRFAAREPGWKSGQNIGSNQALVDFIPHQYSF